MIRLVKKIDTYLFEHDNVALAFFTIFVLVSMFIVLFVNKLTY